MTNRNPFYVHPGTDFGPGLTGLAKTVSEIKTMKKAEREETLMQQEISAAIKSGDATKIRTVAGKYTEFGTKIKDIMEMKLPGGSSSAYTKALFDVSADFSQAPQVLENLRTQFAKDGIDLQEQAKLDKFESLLKSSPETAQKIIESELALTVDDETWDRYQDIKGDSAKAPAKVQEFEYFRNLKETNPDLADQFALGAGFVEGDEDRSTAAEKNFNKYIELSNTNPEQAKMFGDQIGINRNTPLTDIAKLKTDLDNNLISAEDYENQRNAILNPAMKNKIELTQAALKGDPEAIAILGKMTKDIIDETGKKSFATTEGKLKGLFDAIDIEGTADGIIAGRETIENVKNTFGIPIQETVRRRVLEKEPDFNFIQPRAIAKSLSSSLVQQQKNRGAMGNFVLNINGQLDKVDEIMNSVINRVGIRYIDLPWRTAHVEAIGSGSERVLEAYMKEISVEIFKLSQGSTASVALLPEKGRIEWEKIHDVNLSYRELKKVLEGTRDMANIRLKSVNDEIKATVDNLANVRSSENIYLGGPDSPGAEFTNTVTVVNPNTGEEETWDTSTETRVK